MSFDHDPEMPIDADADLNIVLNGDDNFASTNNVDRRNVGTMIRWIIGSIAMAFLFAVTIDVDALVFIKQPADITSGATTTTTTVKRVANDNLFDLDHSELRKLNLFCSCISANDFSCHPNNACENAKKCTDPRGTDECNSSGNYVWQRQRERVANNNLLEECCVNTATNTCHATDKCNKKEKECKKCNNKTSDDYTWMLPGGSPPTPPPGPPDQPDNGGGTTDGDGNNQIENPCCAIIATNTCHEDNKCNQKVKNCENKKCQKNGVAVWQVPSKQSSTPTSAPSNSPTPKPSTSAPSPTPTSSPTGAPTNPVPATPAPTGAPTLSTPAPTGAPTLSTPAPSKNPTTAPTVTVDSTVYEYTNTGRECDLNEGGDNVQGPAPLADKRNVVLDFWAWGDSPYDFMVDTCLDKDGDPSTCKDCAKKNSDMKKMPYPNTCTFEGADFKCVKETIIPFMNGKMDQGDGAFQVHLGDILKGTNAAANSRRCTPASFDSRAKLFQPAKNFLLINGDNESNECVGYDINKPTDPVREMWRERFGQYSFTSDFPAITGGGRPT
eukprot:scaffold1978_cov144-Skeletonema_menzelii.AAC.13